MWTKKKVNVIFVNPQAQNFMKNTAYVAYSQHSVNKTWKLQFYFGNSSNGNAATVWQDKPRAQPKALVQLLVPECHVRKKKSNPTDRVKTSSHVRHINSLSKAGGKKEKKEAQEP